MPPRENHIAQQDLHALLRRLRGVIADRQISLRELCRQTQRLDPPERVHHSALSDMLAGRPGRRLDMQKFLALLRLLGTSPAQLFLDAAPGDVAEAEAVAQAWLAAPRATRARVRRLLHEQGGGQTQRRRLQR